MQRNKYDVIIIGAGIGGLVCGSYLAKQGLEILIVEQHSKVGGYCSSFKRNGFIFDACVHALASFRKNGLMADIIHELGIDLEIIKSEPSDIVLINDRQIIFEGNTEKTIVGLQKLFPKEGINIRKFINFTKDTPVIQLYAKLKNKTLKNLVDIYFKDNNLKMVFKVLSGNIGLHSNLISALSYVLYFKEFILDGGYYPRGGIQSLPDALVSKFKRNGGMIMLSAKVKRIKVSSGKTEGVLLESGNYIRANYIVSNADAIQTFKYMLDEETLPKRFASRLDEMVVSPSAFITYLGLDNRLDNGFNTSTWFYRGDEIDETFNNWRTGNIEFKKEGFLCIGLPSRQDPKLLSGDKDCMVLLEGAPFKNAAFWQRHRKEYSDIIIDRASEVFPGIKKHIKIKETATPATLYKYTLNHRGAMYGWASLIRQVGDNRFPEETFIDGLYLVGHWSGPSAGQGGVPFAAHSGRSVAKKIIKKIIKEI